MERDLARHATDRFDRPEGGPWLKAREVAVELGLKLVTVTKEELLYCTKNVIPCLQAFKLAEDARNETQRLFGQQVFEDYTRANAFQHWHWSALMAVYIGNTQSRNIGNLHELCQLDGPSKYMDTS